MEVQVLDTNEPGRYNVILRVDGRPAVTMKNVHQISMSTKATRAVVVMLKKYVNHRRRIIEQHGAVNTAARRQALVRCSNRLDLSANWTAGVLKKFICKMENDLLEILPGHTSKYYLNDSRFIFDLLQWAKPSSKEMVS